MKGGRMNTKKNDAQYVLTSPHYRKFQLLVPQADGTLQTREAPSLTSPTHARTNAGAEIETDAL
jgi:hypothetical protein